MKNEKTIFLNDALKLMNEKEVNGFFRPFNLVVRTFNSQTSKGGALRCFYGARILPEKNQNKTEKTTIHNVLNPVKSKRRPMHWANRTRNIELSDGSVRKIRIDFIISINDLKVIY